MIEIIIIIILVILSLALAFLPHSFICQYLRYILPNCFPLWIHLGASIIFFIIAIIIYHNDYLLRLKIHE